MSQTPTCPKPQCGGTRFEAAEPRPVGNASIALCFIQCDRCGTVVGVMNQNDPGELVRQLAEKMRIPLE